MTCSAAVTLTLAFGTKQLLKQGRMSRLKFRYLNLNLQRTDKCTRCNLPCEMQMWASKFHPVMERCLELHVVVGRPHGAAS